MFRLSNFRAAARGQTRRLTARAAGGALAAAALGGVSLAAAPAALASVSATSPSGMVSVSTPLPVLTGVVTVYTLTITDVSSQPATSAQAGVQLPAA
ncbi:MAG: hypothetical protein NVSMB25_12950 [Thermoleophilaceae bacterium]